jgi:hypothetical protein
MAFPEVVHCLVCEDVRPELYKKLTILGLFGILPDVDIRLADLTKPIERIAFVLLCGPSEPGPASVRVDIRHEDGTTLVTFDPVNVQLSKANKTNLSFGANNLPVPKPGTYLFTLSDSTGTLFSSRFTIQQGAPEEFKPG